MNCEDLPRHKIYEYRNKDIVIHFDEYVNKYKNEQTAFDKVMNIYELLAYADAHYPHLLKEIKPDEVEEIKRIDRERYLNTICMTLETLYKLKKDEIYYLSNKDHCLNRRGKALYSSSMDISYKLYV